MSPVSIRFQLYDLCYRFIQEHKISCAESIYQPDEVQDDISKLLEDICETIGYYKE